MSCKHNIWLYYKLYIVIRCGEVVKLTAFDYRNQPTAQFKLKLKFNKNAIEQLAISYNLDIYLRTLL